MLIIPAGINLVDHHDKQSLLAFRDRQTLGPCEARAEIDWSSSSDIADAYNWEPARGVGDCTPRPRKDGVETGESRLTFTSPAVAMSLFRGMV